MSQEKTKFLQYCGLTCFGGSEKKQCPCPGPGTCELKDHPQFTHYRNEAMARMYRYLRNGIQEDTGSSTPPTCYEIIKHQLTKPSLADQIREATLPCAREGRHQLPYLRPCPECGRDWMTEEEVGALHKSPWGEKPT